MEPQIQYCTTSDGVNIAYWTLGEGEPLVCMPWSPFSHIELEWQDPDTRHFFEGLASGGLLVHYDSRGSGLSDRTVEDLSLASRAWDLESVVDQLGLERFDLVGLLDGTAVCTTYATQHPEQVSGLALYMPNIRGDEAWPPETARGIIELIRSNWPLARRTIAEHYWPHMNSEKRSALRDVLQKSVSSQIAAKYFEAISSFDIRSLLPQVRVPTIVIHSPGYGRRTAAAGQEFAGLIPNARFVVSPEGSDTISRPIRAFLDKAWESLRDTAPPSSTAIILFADIANSTGLTEELGDAAFREKARALDTALREAISSAGGTAIEGKLLGDGVLATFGAAREAIACARACHVAGDGVDLKLHVGIHAGDVIREQNNVFGGAVNVAARISDASEAGETLVSGTVRDLARTSAGVEFEDKGECDLKGVSEAVRVWAVR